MTHAFSLWNSKQDFLRDLFNERERAAKLLKLEYESAVKIQAWFRGIRLRAYLNHLNNSATVIQKYWRGYVACGIFREMVSSTLKQMREAQYNAMATLIQKTWRGYFVRKYVHNFYARKRYLEGVVETNMQMLEGLYEFEDMVLANDAKKQAEKEKNERVMLATRNHFMLSTHQSAGVYKQSHCKEMREIEWIMRDLKSTDISAILRKQSPEFQSPTFTCMDSPRDQSQLTRTYTYTEQISIASATTNPSPLHTTLTASKKPQGPFKSLDQVQKLKSRPFKPTLRVSTDFYSVDKARESMLLKEEVKQVIAEPFLPFKTVRHAHVPMLHSSSKYGSVKYGTEHFRDDDMECAPKERFKTVLPPIKVFDQANSSF